MKSKVVRLLSTVCLSSKRGGTGQSVFPSSSTGWRRIRAATRSRPAVASPETAPVDANAEATVNNVNSLIQRVAGTSLAEIEKLISELESLRDLLHAEGQRVQREISGYAQLSQAAMKSTRMIADNVTQWKRAADGLRNS